MFSTVLFNYLPDIIQREPLLGTLNRTAQLNGFDLDLRTLGISQRAVYDRRHNIFTGFRLKLGVKKLILGYLRHRLSRNGQRFHHLDRQLRMRELHSTHCKTGKQNQPFEGNRYHYILQGPTLPKQLIDFKGFILHPNSLS